MSLRGRITLGLGAIALLVSLAGVIGATVSTQAELDQQVDAFLKQRVREFTDGRRGDGGSATGARDDDPRGGDDSRLSIAGLDAITQLLDGEGAIVRTLPADTPLPVDDRDIALARRSGGDRYRTVEVGDTEVRMVTASLPGAGAVQIGRDQTEVNAVVDGLRSRLVLVGLIATVAAALLGWWLARRLTRPIEKLDRAAADIAATQDLSTRVPAEGSDEIGRLAGNFNSMVSALEQSRHQQHRLVMDASHELRTPLTSLRTNIDLVQRADDLPEDDRDRLFADVSLELRELSDLVTELVELATDTESDDEPVEDTDLGELVSDVVDRAVRRSQREIRFRSPSAAVMPVRPTMLARAVSNLIDNAVKYAPEGAIDVVVDGARISVRDRGPGIPTDERELVFERFYRADEARTRPGSGLGLAIVAQIVDRHGGRATAREPDPGDADSGDGPGAEMVIDLG